jgi:hypothetical protein
VKAGGKQNCFNGIPAVMFSINTALRTANPTEYLNMFMKRSLVEHRDEFVNTLCVGTVSSWDAFFFN